MLPEEHLRKPGEHDLKYFCLLRTYQIKMANMGISNTGIITGEE